MAKPHRYPRKLRQTLERIAEARDDRESGFKPNNFSDSAEMQTTSEELGRTLWDQFLHVSPLISGVNTMLVRVDARRLKLHTRSTIRETEQSYLAVPAPWLDETSDPAGE